MSPSKSAVGGSGNEAGSRYRASVAAWFVTYGLSGQEIPGLDLDGPSVPELVALEVDGAVDDIRVQLLSGAVVHVQAKRSISLGSEEFRKAARQWASAAISGVDPSRERLILATRRLTGQVAHLAGALDRRRHPGSGSPSSGEAAAYKVFEGLVADCDPDQVTNLCHAIRIIGLDVEEDESPQAQNAIAFLVNLVNQPDDAPRAWSSLVGYGRLLAVKRHGNLIEGWLRYVTQSGIGLRQDNPVAGEIVLRWQAIDRYLGDLQRRGSTIDLLGIGLALPPLAVDVPASGLRVDLSGSAADRRPDSHWLSLAVRRRARSVLTGLPGAGKSVALQQLAGAWASDHEAPLPFIVKLPDVARLRKMQDGDSALIDAALVGVREPDRDLLRTELRTRMVHGGAALLLDALDETRDERFWVVQALSQTLEWVHADNVVLLSTRDVGYAAAARLGFAPLRLLPPEDLDRTLEQLLELVASRDGIPAESIPSWVRDRLTWLEAKRRDIPSLKEAPMMQVLLAVLIARHSAEDVPSSRGAILSRVIDDIVERLGIRRSGGQRQYLLGVSDETSGLILKQGFQEIGHVLFSRMSATREEVDSVLSEMLVRDWGYQSHPGLAVAAEIRSFWDESGVFVAEEASARISPRLRLFAEVAEARFEALRPAEQQRLWVREAGADEQAAEALLLASDLSAQVADELVRLAEENPQLRVVLLAARAYLGSAGRSDLQFIDGLVDLLLAVLRESQEDAARKVADALVRLDIPVSRRDEVSQAISENLPEAHALVLKALAVITWEIAGTDADTILEQTLHMAQPEPLGGARLRFRSVDDAFVRVLVGAARRLLPNRPDLAGLVAEACGRTSMNGAVELVETLTRFGYQDAATAATNRWLAAGGEWLRRLVEEDDGIGRLMDLVAEGPHREMGFGEHWRLDALADLWATMEIGEAGIWDVRRAVDSGLAELREVLETVAQVAGFDRRMLASQAEYFLQLPNRLEAKMLIGDAGHRRPLSDWASLEDIGATSRRLARLIGSESAFVSELACSLIAACPEEEQAFNLILDRMPTLSPDQTRRAAASAVSLHPDDLKTYKEWQRGSDVVLRAVAGAAIMIQFEAGAATIEDVRPSVRDPDLYVRYLTVRGLNPEALRQETRSLLINADLDAVVAATCPYCWHSNELTDDSCGECKAVLPRPAVAMNVLPWPASDRKLPVLTRADLDA